MTFSSTLQSLKDEVVKLASTVDLAKLEETAVTAFETGGLPAVLPALAAHTSDYIADPTEAKYLAGALQIALIARSLF